MDSWTGWSFTFRLIISFLIWKRIINFKKFSVAFCKTKYNETTDILRITQLLPFYRYESDISSFLEDDTVLSDMEVFDLKIRA